MNTAENPYIERDPDEDPRKASTASGLDLRHIRNSVMAHALVLGLLGGAQPTGSKPTTESWDRAHKEHAQEIIRNEIEKEGQAYIANVVKTYFPEKDLETVHVGDLIVPEEVYFTIDAYTETLRQMAAGKSFKTKDEAQKWVQVLKNRTIESYQKKMEALMEKTAGQWTGDVMQDYPLLHEKIYETDAFFGDNSGDPLRYYSLATSNAEQFGTEVMNCWGARHAPSILHEIYRRHDWNANAQLSNMGALAWGRGHMENAWTDSGGTVYALTVQGGKPHVFQGTTLSIAPDKPGIVLPENDHLRKYLSLAESKPMKAIVPEKEMKKMNDWMQKWVKEKYPSSETTYTEMEKGNGLGGLKNRALGFNRELSMNGREESDYLLSGGHASEAQGEEIDGEKNLITYIIETVFSFEAEAAFNAMEIEHEQWFQKDEKGHFIFWEWIMDEAVKNNYDICFMSSTRERLERLKTRHLRVGATKAAQDIDEVLQVMERKNPVEKTKMRFARLAAETSESKIWEDSKWMGLGTDPSKNEQMLYEGFSYLKDKPTWEGVIKRTAQKRADMAKEWMGKINEWKTNKTLLQEVKRVGWSEEEMAVITDRLISDIDQLDAEKRAILGGSKITLAISKKNIEAFLKIMDANPAMMNREFLPVLFAKEKELARSAAFKSILTSSHFRNILGIEIFPEFILYAKTPEIVALSLKEFDKMGYSWAKHVPQNLESFEREDRKKAVQEAILSEYDAKPNQIERMYLILIAQELFGIQIKPERLSAEDLMTIKTNPDNLLQKMVVFPSAETMIKIKERNFIGTNIGFGGEWKLISPLTMALQLREIEMKSE